MHMDEYQKSKNVIFDAINNRFRAFYMSSSTSNLSSKRINKTFSVSKFGFDGARERAEEWIRAQQGKNNLDQVYTVLRPV